MARGTWPADPKSVIVGQGIDWRAASPLAFQAPVSIWKRVSQPDAQRLMEDPRYKPIYKTLPVDVQEILTNIAIQKSKEEQKQEEDGQRDAILKEVDAAIREAGDADNINAKLQGIKLKAELFQLLSKKPVEDTQVTINVITGVER